MTKSVSPLIDRLTQIAQPLRLSSLFSLVELSIYCIEIIIKNLESAHKCGVPFFCPLDALCSHVKRSINQTLFAQFLLGKRVSLLHKDLCIIQGIPAQCSMKKLSNNYFFLVMQKKIYYYLLCLKSLLVCFWNCQVGKTLTGQNLVKIYFNDWNCM